MPRINPILPEAASREVAVVYDELKKSKWRVPRMYEILAHHLPILKCHQAYFNDDAIRVLRKYVKMDPKVAPASYDLYRSSFPSDGRIAEKGIELVAEQEFANGRIKRKVTLDEMIDRTFMNTLGGK